MSSVQVAPGARRRPRLTTPCGTPRTLGRRQSVSRVIALFLQSAFSDLHRAQCDILLSGLLITTGSLETRHHPTITFPGKDHLRTPLVSRMSMWCNDISCWLQDLHADLD